MAEDMPIRLLRAVDEDMRGTKVGLIV